MAFKNQNPARGRKPKEKTLIASAFIILRTRTPQGDGNCLKSLIIRILETILRTRTPQGDGNNLMVEL